MNLQQLRYFIQVAESGSFTRAAVKLNLAQPALSKQIRLLEEDLGVLLFRRDGRGVELTAAGGELVQRANALFSEFYEMRQAVMAYRGIADGHVTIGISPLLGALMVPTLLLQTRQAHPNVTLNFMVGMSDAIHEWTIAGRVDFGVVSTAVEMSNYLVLQQVASDDLVLVSAELDPIAADGVPVTFAQAIARPLIIPTKLNGIRILIERIARQMGLVVTPAIEVDSVEIIKQLLPTGIGGTILPRFSVVDEREFGLLRSNPIVDPPIGYTMGIVFPVDRPLTRNAAEVADILRSIAIRKIGNPRPLQIGEALPANPHGARPPGH